MLQPSTPPLTAERTQIPNQHHKLGRPKYVQQLTGFPLDVSFLAVIISLLKKNKVRSFTFLLVFTLFKTDSL